MNFVYTFSFVITVSLVVHYIILINLSLSFLNINILQIDYILFAQHGIWTNTKYCYFEHQIIHSNPNCPNTTPSATIWLLMVKAAAWQ